MRRLVVALVMLGACHNARGIVNQPPITRDAPTRGSAAERSALTADDELAMTSVIITRFFRPTGRQARWIDPRPLGDVRGPADSSAVPDDAWADAVRDATGHSRVCVFDPDVADACHGRDGGVLRFSHPYRESASAARVFVRWTPARSDNGGPLPTLGQPVFEMVFSMERSGQHGWRIGTQRAIHP